MRLAVIRTEDQVNRFLEKFLPRFNERFAKVPKKEGGLHRSLPKGVNLREILCIKATRPINNGYIVRWKGKRFLIDNASIAIRRRKVEVREHFNGEHTIKFNGRYLNFHEVFEPKPLKTQPQKVPVNGNGKKKGKYIPPSNHPWRRHNPALHHNSYLKRFKLISTGNFCVAQIGHYHMAVTYVEIQTVIAKQKVLFCET